jgi:hypothetical protein
VTTVQRVLGSTGAEPRVDDTVITPLVILSEDFIEEKYFYLHENIHKEGRVI